MVDLFNVSLLILVDAYFANDYSTLTRGSLNVQHDFRRPNYHAESLFVVTFEHVRVRDQRQQVSGALEIYKIA
jgi:hypothetical protein